MSDDPIPYEAPEGMVLTTAGEVRRLGLDWRWPTNLPDTRWPSTWALTLDHCLVLAYPKPRPVVEVDAEALVALWSLAPVLASAFPVAAYESCTAAVEAAREALS